MTPEHLQLLSVTSYMLSIPISFNPFSIQGHSVCVCFASVPAWRRISTHSLALNMCILHNILRWALPLSTAHENLLHSLHSWLLSLQRKEQETNLVRVEGSILTCFLGKLSHNLIATYKSRWICKFGGKVQLWKLSITEKTFHVTPLIFQEEKLWGTEHELCSSPPSNGCTGGSSFFSCSPHRLPMCLCVHIHIPAHEHSHQGDLCWGHPFPALPATGPVSSGWLLLTYPLPVIPLGSRTNNLY